MMNATAKRIMAAVTVAFLSVCMVFATAAPSSAATKKTYKIPYKIAHKNPGGSFTQTFNIKSCRLTSVKYGGEYPSTAKLAYKSSSKIILTFSDNTFKQTLTVSKNKVVKRTVNNGLCKYTYDKNGKLKKAVIDNSTEEHGENILTMTFTRNKKGDVTKKVEHLVDRPADETLEPTDITTNYKYTNKYKDGRLKTQKITYSFDGNESTSSKTITYKKLKMTKTQYKRYMNMWDLFNEVI